MKAKSRPSPYRAFRGSSWAYDARLARVACRLAFMPPNRRDSLGLRLVRRVS